MKRDYTPYWQTITLALLVLTTFPACRSSSGAIDLFNGRDLSGWETYLGQTPDSSSVLGVNVDPYQVFTVQDGAIRISGQVWGALTSVESFQNYRLRAEFRWGEKKWPPRLDAKRDSGILYHAGGEHGVQYGSWMRSMEMQIQEGDCGDYHSLGGAVADIEAERVLVDGAMHLRYTPGAPVVSGVEERAVKSADNEKPTGEWNVAEVILDGDAVTHIMNGKVVLRTTRARHTVGGVQVPLTAGRIQIQSEGAEIFFRKIQVLPLPGRTLDSVRKANAVAAAVGAVTAATSVVVNAP